MSEAGSIDLTATVSNYLGAKLNDATGTTNKPVNGACTGAVGPFVPAYFQVAADPDWKRTTAPGGMPQYYSGEPAINVNLSARNRQGGVTVNYTKEVARDVRLDAIAVDAGGKETVAGAVTRAGAACASGGAGPVCAEEFSAGVAAKAGATLWKTGTITLPAKSAPLTAKIRATDTDKASSSAAPSELSVVVRVGRVRLSNIYGSAGKPLSMPVNVEYWTGNTWMRNTDHNDTVLTFPAATFALPGLAGVTASGVTIAKGAGTLQLQPPAGSGRASGAVVLNLGAGTAANLPCPGVTAATTQGANKAYLRVASCAGTAVVDPSARASFGLNPPETRRIIHVREVFR
jgi:MSHA biogenesis protein MshQ